MDSNNKSARLKANPTRLFDCYCEVSFKPRESNGIITRRPWIKRRFPDSYKNKEILESVPKFAYPCENIVIETTTLFSFVLTNIESKWTFGFCRISPTTDICTVLLSQLPWHETFFKIITQLASTKPEELLDFLKNLYYCKVPTPLDRTITVNRYVFEAPDQHVLPSIPQDRNLTEYYNAVSIDNMITLFASALNERHIVVTSKKLDKLTACVQAINNLLYPMQWQHIFIPVLPSDLVAYLQAPMPFMIGVLEPMFRKLKLDEVVLLMADEDVVHTPFEDVKNLSPGLVSSIKSDLKNQVALGDTVSRAFLRALVMLIGGYREALEFNDGQKITFNQERFIATRPSSFQPFLKKMLELQMFRQFIDGRLELLNSGQGFNDDFEFEVNLYEERTARTVNIQYQDWLNAMKSKSGTLIKSINPSLKLVYQGLKDKSRQAYKSWRESQSSGQAPSFFYSRLD